MRPLLPLLIALLLPAAAAGQPGVERAAQPANAISLAELETLALASSPAIRQAQARVDAARAQARQAGAWPNPVAGYVGEELPLGDAGPRGAQGVFVEQAIPLGGKLRLGRAVFDRSAERAEIELDWQRQRVVSSVRIAFYEVLTLERRVQVHERLAALVSEAVAVTAQLFNVGAADRPDFLESEIESKRVDLALTAAKNRAFAVRQHLAALAGADVAARPLAGSIDAGVPELERDAAVRALLEQSPEIRAARAGLARAQALVAQARRETFPDLLLRGGVEYNRERSEASMDAVGWQGRVEAGVSLPLFNRNSGAIAAARADELRAQAELERLELSLRSRIGNEFATYLTSIRASEVYGSDILPRAEEAFRLYLARYREMAAAYPQVLIAQRNLLELSSEYLQHLEDAWRSALRIQALLAGDGLQAPATGAESESEERRSTVRGGRE
jgi:cobalt-zinc-cadmium efflux system outer membrane protein